MMHFEDCPTCGQKILNTAPHLRTDKWITQLFDLATPEFRQDRDMCTNYRKLQQVKLELIGSEDLKRAWPINKDSLLQEFNRNKNTGSKSQIPIKDHFISTSPSILNSQIQTDSSPNQVPVETKESDFGLDLEPLYVKNSFGLSTNSQNQLTDYLYEKNGAKFSDDITSLFGPVNAPTPFPTRIPSHDLTQKEVEDQDSVDNLDNASVRSQGEKQEADGVTDQIFPPSVNSARTFSLHYPGSTSRLLTLAELTCHDELVLVQDNDEADEEDGRGSNNSFHDLISKSYYRGTGDGDKISDPRLALQGIVFT